MDATSTGMIGKYQVIRVLGRGGMGEVVLAQDDQGRRVAIKRPFKSALEDGLARFKLEARASTLSHPNIPAVYEMGMQDGLPFIAMEYVEGDPLDKLIASGKPMELIQKLSIIEQVCAGLGHAHQKGIIHRDIKPANVIVQPNGVVKIIDFGIAKIQNLEQTSGLTQTSQIIGSLHYIAPERFKGEAIDGRVDVFSAGVMLYLLLTGHLPFGGGEATASYRIVNEAHTKLASHIKDYPPALDAIMDQALAKDPEDRFRTAEDFADALHDVIEELKKTRVFQLVDDAERLNMESRFAPALELLDEALKLDPANTQARKLRRFVREHQERQKRAERIRELIVRAEELMVAESYLEALAQLKDAQRLDAAYPDLAEKIQFAEEKKRLFDLAAAAMAEATAAKDRGDITMALRITERAVQQDPENTRLLAVRGALAKQLESEALQSKVTALIDSARREVLAQHFPAAEQLLTEAEAIDPSHPKIDEMRRELARLKEQEERRQLLEEIQKRVNDFLRADNYEQAIDLLNRAIDRLPTETALHRLRVEVETAARRFDAKRFVDSAISAARETFSSAPLDALAGLQRAIEQMPGEERLISYERTLRQEYEARQVQQMLGDTLRKARDLITDRQFDKAIGVLESYQLEFGKQADVDDLLTFAKNELAGKQRRMLVERTTAEVRSLIRDERLDDAARLLESVLSESGDATLGRMLEDVREQQTALARKQDVLQKRISLLRERGELDEAVQVLQEYLRSTPKSPMGQELLTAVEADRERKKLEALQTQVSQLRQRGALDEAIQVIQEYLRTTKSPVVQELLTAVQAERELKQVSQQAIATAMQAAQRAEFSVALEALQTVVRAYGDSPEVTQVIQQVQAGRTSYAQEVVGRSIEAARAELLKKEPEGALNALKEAAAWVEFADAKRQADWQRIAKSAKEELRRTPEKGSTAALDQLDVDGIKRAAPRKSPVALFVVGGVAVLGAAGALIWWKMQPPPAPPVSTEAHIVVAKAPPGAEVRVGNAAPVLADANGDISIPVKAGSYHLVVSKAGFAPFSDDITVGAGETYRDPAPLTALGKSGTLAVSGNVPNVKVFVDDIFKGTVSAGKPIPLEVGTHKVRYSAPGFVDSPTKSVTIALNAETSDTFSLTALPPPAPDVGNLMIETNPGAHVSIDGGQHSGVADANGSYAVNGLTPGNHTISASLDGFTALQGKQVAVVKGQNVTANAQMAAIPPSLGFFKADQLAIENGQSVSLSWQVNNTSSAAIDGIGSVSPSGSRSVSPDQTTTYKLSAGGNVLQSVTVTVRPKPQVVAQQQAPLPAAAPPPVKQTGPPDYDTLLPAVNGYKSVYVRASGKSTKECEGIFNSSYGGALKLLSRWCDNAKQFEAVEKCTEAPGGTEDAPTLACNEILTIVTKDGNKFPSAPIRKTFHFSKADGSWKVTKLD